MGLENFDRGLVDILVCVALQIFQDIEAAAHLKLEKRIKRRGKEKKRGWGVGRAFIV